MKMDLLEWASAYIDNLNFFKRDLLGKEMKENTIQCEYKNKGKLIYFIEEVLNEDVIKKTENEKSVIICLNKKENLVFLIEHWQDFIKNTSLKIIFCNPTLNLQWSLLPYTHNLIADKGSLKLGLKSIFESIPSL